MEGKDRTEIKETGRTEGTGTERETSRGTSASRKERGATGTGTGTGAGTGAGTATENKQGEKVPEVVTVNVPEVSEKPKKKRTVKKKAPAKKKEENTFSADMVADLISGCSQVVATKPENAHWNISKQEASQIAEPLVKVIENNENLKKVAEHSDSIALVMACFMVLGPRAYISLNMHKEQKARKKRAVVKEVAPNDRETEKTERGSGKDNRGNANANTNVDPSIHELLSL